MLDGLLKIVGTTGELGIFGARTTRELFRRPLEIGENRNVTLSALVYSGNDLVPCPWNYYADGSWRINGKVSRVERAGASIEANFASQAFAQGRREIAGLRLQRDFLVGSLKQLVFRKNLRLHDVL